MIGYRTDQYRDFGWAAARFDDMLNWVPARLTARLIWLTDRATKFTKITTDARLHRSPNAGWPEAAMAYKCDIALAGPRSYDGVTTDFPYVNTAGKIDLSDADIRAANEVLWTAWKIALGVVFSIAIGWALLWYAVIILLALIFSL